MSEQQYSVDRSCNYRLPIGRFEVTPIRILHSVVDARQLASEILRRYRLARPFQCELFTRGMTDLYLVRAGDRQFAARLYRAGRSEQEVSYEMDLLALLKSERLPVTVPVPAADGSAYFSVGAPEGTRVCALFEWASGVVFSADPKVETATAMGAAVAQGHVVAQRFDRKRERQMGVADYMRRTSHAVSALFAHRPADVEFFEQVAEVLPRALDAIEDRAPMGATSGDSNPHNFLVAPNGFTIMDFESCGFGFLSYELASFHWSTLKNGVDMRYSEAFANGYDQVRPRDAEERELFPLLLCAKEFRYLCAFADNVNSIGHAAAKFPGYEWFTHSVRRHIEQAHLL